MLPVLLGAVVLGFPLLSWAFGDAVLRGFTHLDRSERFAASWGVAFAVYAASAFLAFVTQAPQTTFNLVTLLFMLAVAVTGRFRGWQVAAREKRGLGSLVVLWALGYAHLVCIQALLPNYLGANWWGDWHMHYEEALIFRGELPLGREWSGSGVYTLASRTPLFNLAAAFLLSLTGNEFCWFQLAAALLSSCFLAPLFLVLRDLFGLRTARFGLLLAAVNLWLLHNAWFTWPKMLAAYFLLLGLHFYLQWLRRRETERAGPWFLCFWLSTLLGFMTHQVAAVYLVALLLHTVLLIYREPAVRPSLRALTILALCAVLVAGPWYLWLAHQFGLSHIAGSTPVTQMEDQATQSLPYLLLSIPCNLFLSVVPAKLLDDCWNGPRTLAAAYQGLTDLYFSLLLGALTVSLSLFVLCSHWWKRRVVCAGSRAEWNAVWAFILLGALGATALHPQRIQHGVAHSACFPSVVLLTGLVWGVLSRAPRRWRVFVGCGSIVEFLAMFWTHVYLAHRDDMVLDPDGLNQWIKSDKQVVFLSDRLGAGWYFFLGTAVVIQLLVCAALLVPRRRRERSLRVPLPRGALLR